MQGVKGGGEPPKPDSRELESEISKQMRKAGYDRARAEDYKKKGMVDKLQESTNQIKDAGAAQMDKLGATVKNTFSSEK